MTRTLSIVVTLLAFCAVFAASAGYAVPKPAAEARTMQVVDAEVCTEPHAEMVSLTSTFCVKRHTLGLPCTPLPMILPAAIALPSAALRTPAVPTGTLERFDPASARLFRPPRGTGA